MKNFKLYIIVAIAVVIISTSCTSQSPQTDLKVADKTEVEKIEELILLEKYREAAKECENILYADTFLHSQETRIIAADYMCLCLLKTGDLNNKFYAHRKNVKAKELAFPIPIHPTVARSYYQFECGIALSSYEINIMLVDGQQKSPVFWSLFKKNSLVTERTRYYEAVKSFFRNGQPELQQNMPQITGDTGKTLRGWKEKTKSTLLLKTPTHISGNFLDNFFSLFYVYQNNKEILESHAAIMLFYKQMHLVPEIVERYNKLGYARLPDYIQEAVIIFLQRLDISDYYGFEIEEDKKKQFKDFWQAMENIYTAKETPEGIKQKFGNTYTYYFYIGQ